MGNVDYGTIKQKRWRCSLCDTVPRRHTCPYLCYCTDPLAEGDSELVGRSPFPCEASQFCFCLHCALSTSTGCTKQEVGTKMRALRLTREMQVATHSCKQKNQVSREKLANFCQRMVNRARMLPAAVTCNQLTRRCICIEQA